MKMVRILIIAALGLFLVTAPASGEGTQFSKNKREMRSYAMGVEILKDFNRNRFSYDLDKVLQGMKDAAAGGKLLWSEEVLTTTWNMTVAELKQKKGEAMAGLSRQQLERQARIAQQEKNKKKQEELLAKNMTEEGEESQLSKNKREMQSYAMGVEILRNFNRQRLDYDLDMVLRGLKDAAEGGKLLWSEESLATVHRKAGSELRYMRGQDRMRTQRDNLKAGEEFLAANKTKEGVVALPSGLQYEILKAGDGRKPTDADTVEFRYRGTHIDGTEFDNSEQNGQPAILKKVAEVIPGWREAFKLMSVGSKWQLFIPSQLAYGQRGSGKIGPYETTIYELELVAIK